MLNDYAIILGLGILSVPFNILWASWNIPFELAVITTLIGITIGYATIKHLQ